MVSVNDPNKEGDVAAGTGGSQRPDDTGGDTGDPATFQFVGTTAPGVPLTLPGQGVFTFDPATGDVTFTPEDNFFGSPAPSKT